MPWNHNIHYHQFILNAVPAYCTQALDVGCGYGFLMVKLSRCCGHVTGIDINRPVLDVAEAEYGRERKIQFVRGDFMAYDFGDTKFDFIVAVATLHHLPIDAAIVRFKTLLAQNGKIVVIGLYKPQSIMDYVYAAIAFPISQLIKLVKTGETQHAPMATPLQSYAEINKTVKKLLPGACIKRRLFFRYTVTWPRV